MKRKFYKSLKLISYFVIILGIITTIAYLWPYPNVKTGLKVEGVLIRSVNIIDVTTGDIYRNKDVLTKNGQIVRIDSNQIQTGLKGLMEIDGQGKYLMPGLWNMHTHSTQHSPWLHHPLFIANGVTAVRDMSGHLGRKDSYWAGTTDRQKWNLELLEQRRTCPNHILNSSYQINGPNSVPSKYPDFFRAEDEKDVETFLAHYRDEGSDFIKVYSEIPAGFYRKLTAEAGNYGIHIAGHKPLAVTLEEAINRGQRSFEHPRIFLFDCFANADSLIRASDKMLAYKNLKKEMVSNFDSIKAKELMRLMRERKSSWVPTLQIAKNAALAHEPELKEDENLQYVPRMRKMLWWDPDINRAAESNISSSDQGINLALYRSVQKQVKMAQESGVSLLSGTDVTDSYIFPGFGIHEELEEFTKCGLTNLEALQTATINPAIYSGKEDQYGRVENGYRADLLLLEANPLDEIRNTKSISGVLVSGMYYDKDLLKQLKEDTADIASSFHMNVKFVVDLFRSPLMRKQFAD